MHHYFTSDISVNGVYKGKEERVAKVIKLLQKVVEKAVEKYVESRGKRC